MRNIKCVILFLVIILYLIISNIFLIPNFNNIYYILINPLFWLLMFIMCLLFKSKYKRYKNKVNKTQKVVIMVLLYIIIFYLIGLFLGFENSPYSHNIVSIIKNIYEFVLIIIFEEYIRNYLITNSQKKIDYILITILFVLVNINFQILFINLKNIGELFKYISSTVLPLIFSNILCSYLCFIGSYKLALSYKLPLELMYIIFPIFPALNWLLNGAIGMIFPTIVYLFISYDYQKKEQLLSRKKLKQNNPLLLLPFLSISIILICFVLGLFKYKPMAILSNSMVPTYSRGDIVIFSKPNKKELENIQIYNIIVYRLDNMIVAHRIVNIEKNNKGEVLYTTKGDNNLTVDSKKVTNEQIIGIVKTVVHFIGYPTVWLNDVFSH